MVRLSALVTLCDVFNFVCLSHLSDNADVLVLLKQEIFIGRFRYGLQLFFKEKMLSPASGWNTFETVARWRYDWHMNEKMGAKFVRTTSNI